MAVQDEEERQRAAGGERVLGMPLAGLSVEELEAYLQALARESERVREELARKRAHLEAARALFGGEPGGKR